MYNYNRYGNKSFGVGKGKYRKKKYTTKRSGPYMKPGFDRMIVRRSPVARQSIVTMRYCTSFQLDPGSAGIRAFHRFSCVSIYDPDVTGTGHQPHGHDTYQLLYNHYKVLGAKCTAIFSPTSATAGSGTMVCAIKLDDDLGEPPSDIQNVIEGPDCVYDIAANADAGNNLIRLTKTFSPVKFLGVSKEQWRSAASANFGNNPSEQAYFNVFAAPLNPTVDAEAVNVQLEISYIVLLSEPKDVSPS